jgi:hypothetical protein
MIRACSCYPAQPLGYPLAKLDMILRIIRSLTAFYGVSEHLHRWTNNMAYRESLGSTGVGDQMDA